VHRLFSARCLIPGPVLVAPVQAHGQTDKPNSAPVEALIKYCLESHPHISEVVAVCEPFLSNDPDPLSPLAESLSVPAPAQLLSGLQRHAA